MNLNQPRTNIHGASRFATEVDADYEQTPCCHGRRHRDFQTALNLDPFMIHEMFLYLTETAFGRHPCRVVSVTYRKLRPFHGGNTGSNPVGDANLINHLQIPFRIL